VSVVDGICKWYGVLIPAIVAGLVTAYQQYCCPTWVERIQDAVRPAFMLNPQLAHMRVARRLNPGTMGHSQRWASLLQEADTEVDTLLLDGGQTIPPSAEFIGELNFPCHVLSMS
jgi:hypothetical protein